MGNDESFPHQQTLPLSPVIRKMKNTLHLNITSNKTNSFIYEEFSSSIKKQSGFISRTNNPFCPMIPLESKDDYHNLSCCLISPVMAISSPKVIWNGGRYSEKVKILGMSKKRGKIQATVKDIIMIKQQAICLLLLSQPVIDLGWVGVSCLNSEQEIENEAYKTIRHLRSEQESGKDGDIYKQQMSKCYYKKQKGLMGNCKSGEGSLVFRVIDKKAYVVGVHVNERQAQFMTKNQLMRINEIACKVIDKKTEKRILTAIDIEQLELMEKL